MGGIICRLRVSPINNENITYDSDSDNEITNSLLPSEIMEKEYLKKVKRNQSVSEIYLQPST